MKIKGKGTIGQANEGNEKTTNERGIRREGRLMSDTEAGATN